MRHAFIRYALLVSCLLGIAPRQAWAWNRDGHRIVCRIAWQLLDQTRRTAVDRLTSVYRDPDGQPVGAYWDACSYADDVRAKANTAPAWSRFATFETWHYANVPRSTTALPTPPCESFCVVTAINVHGSQLSDQVLFANHAISRTEALFFLSHWVGDLHQPLHVGFADDRGGNDVRPIEGGYYNVSNMHALWDGGLLGKLIGATSWQDFADQLAREITPAQQASWIQDSPTHWAQESYNIATSPAFQYCDWQVVGGASTCAARPGTRTLGESYQFEFADEVRMRLQQAGVRLAEMLRLRL
jgi:hypothetical protein